MLTANGAVSNHSMGFILAPEAAQDRSDWWLCVFMSGLGSAFFSFIADAAEKAAAAAPAAPAVAPAQGPGIRPVPE
jgi:4-diphosphocytidyl-2C-methyl-D-erythritol kinase